MIKRLTAGAIALCAFALAAPAFAQSQYPSSATSTSGQVQSVVPESRICSNGAPCPDSDPNNTAFQGAVAMTVGTTYTAARSIGMNCTASGNVSLTLSDASTVVVPVVGSSAGSWQQFPFAATAVNTSGTTAACTYYNLK